MAKLNQAVHDAHGALAEIHEILLAAMGGRDGVPEGISTAHLAEAVASQLGGFRAGLRSAGRVSGTWADRLTEYVESTASPDFRVVEVRDALNRHRPTD